MTYPLFDDGEIYSVSEFIKRCQNEIENNVPACWLNGEISNLFRAKSGHIYFSIKDETAQIKCVLFRLNQRQMNFELEDNGSFLIRAKASIYQDRGEFQLIVEKIEPIGIGSLQLAFEQLKKRLMGENLFDPIYKKPLPAFPMTIGVVTSFSGAVINDICKVLKRRYPLAKILIYDTPVQGKGAAEKIAYALDCADDQKRCDVIILARGGGSLEDLWAFNEEVVVRAVFNCTTPVISAIGHQTDRTLADFTADISAPTPSAAAEIVAPDQQQLLNQNQHSYQHLTKLLKQTIKRAQLQLHHMDKRLVKPVSLVRYSNLKLDELTLRLKQAHQHTHTTLNTALSQLSHQLYINAPHRQITHKQTQRRELIKRLQQQINQIIAYGHRQQNHQRSKLNEQMIRTHQHQRHALAKLSGLLNAISPLNTLARGYSLTLNEKQTVITSIDTVSVGEQITSTLKDGIITSSVSAKHLNK